MDKFTYPDESEPVLSDIHFEFKAGETLGIVGRTGSGKTSLLKLLMREYDTYEGKIAFANVKIQDYTVRALREAIGYVPQDQFYSPQRYEIIFVLENQMHRKKK